MNLSVELCGKKLKNPLIVASGTFGFGREYGEFYSISLLGGVSTKGLTLLPREGNDAPRIAETPTGILNSVGLQNPGVEAFLRDDLPYLKQHDTCIIANIAGSSYDDYCRMAEILSGSGVDMIEMNISCPNVKAGGVAFGVRPESVREITERVKGVCQVPLMVKLSPNVACIGDNAAAAEDGGADCISLINTITGMAVDLKSRRPILANVTGGLSGPCVKPIALRMVYECAQRVKIPIVGLGGITSAEDVIEFLLCGARAVQLGTVNLTDPLAGKRILEGLTNYLIQNKIEDINELVGALRV